MKNRLPKITFLEKVCIICEGPEEYEYLDRLKQLKVWNPIYQVDLENADGNGNIPARYQDKYQNGDYDVVLIFCDTDKKPFEQYNDIKRKINEFHGVDDAAEQVMIYGNPCTMQIVLQHWDNVKLKSSAKKVNAPIIEKYTGVSGYKGRADQRKAINDQITKENYNDMRQRVKSISKDDAIVGSTNIANLFDDLQTDAAEWISSINSKLDGE